MVKFFSEMRAMEEGHLTMSLKKILGSYRTITVALSGGVDSSALLAMLVEERACTDFCLRALHINFCLRGEESERDQRFVEEVAAAHRLAFSCYRINSEDLKLKKGRSVQEWARLIRQREFLRVATITDGVIVLAHHRDDLAESVLYRMIRGKSVPSLLGMEEFSPPFWRPLLGTTKNALLLYCQKKGVKFQIDSTNRENVYARNTIRNAVLPMFEKLHDGAAEEIVTTCTEMRDLYLQTEHELVARYRAYLEEGTLPLRVLHELPPCKAKIIVRHLLGNVSRRVFTAILAGINTHRRFTFQLPSNRLAVCNDKNLSIKKGSYRIKKSRTQQYRRLRAGGEGYFILEPDAYAETNSGVVELGSGKKSAEAGEAGEAVARREMI